MVPAEAIFQFLYVSQLAPGCDTGVVRDIVVLSRERNLARHVSGAMLFDGERFCQLIEGAEPDVRGLMRRIENDTRHCGVRILFAGPAFGKRLVPHWTSGYCEPSALDVLDQATGVTGRPALHAFMKVLTSADMA